MQKQRNHRALVNFVQLGKQRDKISGNSLCDNLGRILPSEQGCQRPSPNTPSLVKDRERSAASAEMPHRSSIELSVLPPPPASVVPLDQCHDTEWETDDCGSVVLLWPIHVPPGLPPM